MRCVTHPTRNQPHVKETKTELSRRDIELAGGILSYLPEGRPNDYILGGDKPLSYIKATQEAAGHATATMTLKHYVKGRVHNDESKTNISTLYGLN